MKINNSDVKQYMVASEGKRQHVYRQSFNMEIVMYYVFYDHKPALHVRPCRYKFDQSGQTHQPTDSKWPPYPNQAFNKSEGANNDQPDFVRGPQ